MTMQPANMMVRFTIIQIQNDRERPQELLRMARRYCETNTLVRKAWSQRARDIVPGGYAEFIRKRFPLETIPARQQLAADCRQAYIEIQSKRQLLD